MAAVLQRCVFLAFFGDLRVFNLYPKFVEIGRQQSESQSLIAQRADVYIPRQPNKNNGKSVTS